MMGNRGSANGIEVDAFSRQSRRIVRFGRGELRKLKRAISKRARKAAKHEDWLEG